MKWCWCNVSCTIWKSLSQRISSMALRSFSQNMKVVWLGCNLPLTYRKVHMWLLYGTTVYRSQCVCKTQGRYGVKVCESNCLFPSALILKYLHLACVGYLRTKEGEQCHQLNTGIDLWNYISTCKLWVVACSTVQLTSNDAQRPLILTEII